MTLPIRRFSIALMAALLATSVRVALAEKADRDKPVNLEADRVTVDDRNKVHVFQGRVTLTQGTLVIRGDKVVVSQDASGFQKGVASGGADGLARIRQKREGRNDYMEGEAERIEYDSATERAQFFNRAYVKSGQDEARGQYISYDGLKESYVVSSGPEGTMAKPASGRDNRVRVVIQPKERTASPSPDSSADAGKTKDANESAKPR
jgi:lipopolysaccharide export system protein LptA